MLTRMALLASVAVMVLAAPATSQSPPAPSKPAPSEAGPSEPGPTESTVSLEALAVNFPGDAGKVRSAIFFGLSLAEVPQGPRSVEASASLKRGGEVVDTFEITADLTVDDLDDRRRLQFYGDLGAAPGSYQLSLRIGIDGLTHVADYPFQLDMPVKDGPAVLPPILLDDEGFVAAFFEGEPGADPREPPADYPLFAAGEQLVPDIAPRLGVDVPRRPICLILRELMQETTFLETGTVYEDGTLLSKARLALISQDEPTNDRYETSTLGPDTHALTE